MNYSFLYCQSFCIYKRVLSVSAILFVNHSAMIGWQALFSVSQCCNINYIKYIYCTRSLVKNVFKLVKSMDMAKNTSFSNTGVRIKNNKERSIQNNRKKKFRKIMPPALILERTLTGIRLEETIFLKTTITVDFKTT